MADERRFTHLLCGQIHVRQSQSDDDAIAELALNEHGVVTRAQLLELGVSRRAIEHRLAVGRLRLLFPGVYAVGHEALAPAGHELAAVMAVWPGAVAGFWSASVLHGVARWQGRIHVVAEHDRRPRRGLTIHRAALPQQEVTTVDGVPVTTVARTLLDMSGATDARHLRSMVKRAEYKKLISPMALVEILNRYPRRRGRRALAEIVDGYALTTGPTLSPLEDDFIEFCARRNIPLPRTNVPMRIGGRSITVDCLWADARLAVELDGRDAHDRHFAFEDDRAREADIRAALATNVDSDTQEGPKSPFAGTKPPN